MRDVTAVGLVDGKDKRLAAKNAETLGIKLVDVYTEALMAALSRYQKPDNVIAEAPVFNLVAYTLLRVHT